MLKIASPGRVNLIGEHTDYSLGYVMPMAINLYTFLEGDAWDYVEFYSETLNSSKKFETLKLLKKGDWADYLRGIYWVLHSHGYFPGGARGKIYGNLPIEAGLSSSASLELALFKFLNTIYKMKIDGIKMALMAQQAENEFVGVPCGIMDHMIISLAKKDFTLFIDTETLKYEYVPFPKELRILIFNTGIKRELSRSEYGKRRKIIENALKKLNKKSSKYIDAEKLNLLSSLEKRMLGYVLRENQRVLDARDALKDKNLESFGNILLEAHWDLANNYNVSCKELDFFVNRAMKYGALGSRLTGAGFGGSALAIFTYDPAQVAEKILNEYESFFSYKGSYFIVSISEGVRVCTD